MFTDFYSLELEVPTFCLVTGCVSARRDRRYSYNLKLSIRFCILPAIIYVTHSFT
jgi:hypothetical protein